MRRLVAWLLAGTVLLCAGAAQASLQLRLKTDGLSPAQQQASQALLDEAMRSLPPRFVEQLDRRIDVGWTDKMPDNAYGQASLVSELDLNRNLLDSLTDGSAATQKTHRPHGTVRREMLATVLHELTHIYDRARLWSPDERTLIQRCSRQNSITGLIGLPDQCRGQNDRRFSLSDDPRLLDLAGWPQYVGRRGEREQHNRQVARSPDIYETTSPLEFVAVNMEYFLLDPSYACRRPALFRYYQQHFGWAPPVQDACAKTYPFLNAGNDFAKTPLGHVDPERVYEIDYLLAEANQNLVSRWGHSMLRLVICAPGRPRGPDCRLDLDQHLVLSYRAFVGDVQLSSWDGLVGKYPSRLFVLPLAQVIDEYTKTELRGLASVPLKLSRQEINDTVEHAAEMHWSYDGNYYFLSNNCAVESLKLLRSGSANPQLTGLDNITPNGLLEVLQARGLADTSVLNDKREALRLGYHFDSFREQASFRKQLMLAQDEVKQRYLGARELKNGGMEKANATLQQILANSGFLSRPAELLDSGGYGLPQPSEAKRLESESAERQKQLQSLTGELDKEVRALLEPARAAEIAACEANLKQLGEHLRSLHKAAGGLELP